MLKGRKKTIFSYIIICMFSLLIFSSNTKADGTSNLTSIMGQAQLTKDQAFEYFRSKNTSKDDKYIREFISIVWEEGQAEGIRPDVAFIQIMKETNFLKFTGDVKEEQNNFAGIGATGGGVQGAYFPNVRTGIRAVIQHLKAYASNKNLVNTCVDPRFQYVSRGISPYVEWLGIGENPNYPDRGWAADNNYGKNIMEMLNSAKPHNTGDYVANIETFDIMLDNNYVTGTNKLDKGKTYTIKGYASSPNAVLYEFWIKDLSTGNLTKIRNYEENRYANWTPNKNGKYEITINVKDKYSNKSVDGKYTKTFEISQRAGKANIETFDIMLGKDYISGTNKLDKGKTYTIKGYANSPNGVLYEFWVKDLSTGNSTKIRSYEENRYANWTPNKDGKYDITINVKDKYSNQSIDGKYTKTFEISQRAGRASIETFDIMLGKNYISGTNKLDKGKTYTIKGYANSPNGVLYEFWVKDLSTGNSTKIRSYEENRYANWTPKKDGKYEITINVKDRYSSQSIDGKYTKTFEISQRAGKANIETFDIMLGKDYISGTNKLDKGKTYTIKGYASAPNGVLYEFWVKDLSTGNSTKIRNYEENRYANWTPNKDGKYEITINVKDRYSSQSIDGKYTKTFEISQRAGKASIETFDIMLGKNYISGTNKLDKGKTYTIKGYASAPNAVLYEFWVKDLSTGNSTKIRSYEENRYAKWTPDKEGRYEITINVKDRYSNQSIDGKYTKTFEVGIKAGKASIETFDIMLGKNYISGTNKLDKGKTYTIKGYASAPNGVLYEFWAKDIYTGKSIKIRDYKEDRYANWTPDKDGRYEIIVNVKDKYSNQSIDAKYTKTFEIGIKTGNAIIETFDIMLGKNYISGTNKLDKGKTYTIKGYASSPNGVLYEFWVKDLFTGNTTKIREYKEDRYASWTTNKDGRYEVIVNVKDKYSAKKLEGNISKTFNVGNVSFGLSGKTIVLDAGHGGKDSGAVSSANTGNIREADLTQKITSKLGTLLKNAGANVIYTRDRVDNWNYPTVAKNLGDRVKVANDCNADLFISIHIDAADSSSAHGCGTHYSTYRPGLDNSGVYESDGIYYDRTPCDTALKSKILAQLIVDEISSLGLSNRGISDHNLYVTKNTNMPSVLVECGFISNDVEARKLSSDSMQSQVADKIYKGVVKLFGI